MLNKETFHNIKWLFILNIFNTIVPYLVFPYVTRVLTPEGFGTFSFAISFMAYFQTTIDYGFNLTAARSISLYSNDIEKVSRIFSRTLFSKALIFLVCLPIYVVIIQTFGQFQNSKSISFILIIMLLGNMIMPTWLYQGMQKVKVMTTVSVIVRCFYVAFVFIFIKDITDLNLYTILYAVSFFLIGLLSLIMAVKILKLHFCRINLKEVKKGYLQGFYVFLSTIVITIVSSSAVFILGLFSDSAATVGNYSGVQKIVSMITMLYYPIGQGLFPIIAKKFAINFNCGYSYVKKISIVLIPLFFFFTLVMIVFRSFVVKIALGDAYLDSANYLIVMAFIPFCSILSNLLGTQILVASNNNKEYSKAFAKSGIIYILLFVILGYFYAEWGVILAQFIGDFISLLILFQETHKVKKRVSNDAQWMLRGANDE